MCLLDTTDGALMLALYVQPAANFLPPKPDTEPLVGDEEAVEAVNDGPRQNTFRDPIAFLYYSIVLTCLTVLVAIVIGVIQVLSLVLNVASPTPTGKFWEGVETAGEYYDAIGGGIAGCFVVVAVLSVVAYKPWRRWVGERHGKPLPSGNEGGMVLVPAANASEGALQAVEKGGSGPAEVKQNDKQTGVDPFEK